MFTLDCKFLKSFKSFLFQITESVSKGEWARPEKFALKTDFPSLNQSCSKRRTTASKLFKNSGAIYLDPSCQPPPKELKELVTLCGGKVTGSKSRAKCCVGGSDGDCVSEQWVLDSVTMVHLQPTRPYLALRSPSPEYWEVNVIIIYTALFTCF